jgi:hypothetical protein
MRKECDTQQKDDKRGDSLMEEPEKKTLIDKPRRRWEDGRPSKAKLQEI